MARLTSMEMDDERKLDATMPIEMPDKPDFPYGLRISLTHDDLSKLGLDPEDARVGGVFTAQIKAKITDVSHHEHEGGKSSRVEAQITHMSVDDAD